MPNEPKLSELLTPDLENLPVKPLVAITYEHQWFLAILLELKQVNANLETLIEATKRGKKP